MPWPLRLLPSVGTYGSRVCVPVLVRVAFRVTAKQQDVVCPDPFPWVAARVMLIHTPALRPCPSFRWTPDGGLFSAAQSRLCVTRATTPPPRRQPSNEPWVPAVDPGQG